MSDLEHSGKRYWHQEPKPVSTLVFVVLLLVDTVISIGIVVSLWMMFGQPQFIYRLFVAFVVFKTVRWVRKSSMEIDA